MSHPSFEEVLSIGGGGGDGDDDDDDVGQALPI
jgi:hypothetical protein